MRKCPSLNVRDERLCSGWYSSDGRCDEAEAPVSEHVVRSNGEQRKPWMEVCHGGVVLLEVGQEVV